MKRALFAFVILFALCSTAWAVDQEVKVKWPEQFKWWISWEVHTVIYVPCPQPEPKEDEFGRILQSWTQTTQLCSRVEVRKMRRGFKTAGEAMEFIRRGKAANETAGPYGNSPHLTGWEVRKDVTE